MGTERGIILASAAALLLLWIFLTTRRFAPLDLAEGAVVLRYGTPLRIFAWFIVLAIPAPLVWLLLSSTLPRPMDTWVIGFVQLDFLIIGGLLVLETERVRIVLTTAGIVSDSPWRARREIAWADVLEVKFSLVNRWFVVRGTDGKTIRVSTLLGGVRRFAEELKRHVPEERYAAACRALDALV